LKTKIYSFSSLVRSPEGGVTQFAVTIYDGAVEDSFSAYCFVSCAALNIRERKIYGVDADQALKLGIEHVRQILGYRDMILVDDQGRPADLPVPQ
jgi:hypothetical protein